MILHIFRPGRFTARSPHDTGAIFLKSTPILQRQIEFIEDPRRIDVRARYERVIKHSAPRKLAA